MYPLQHPGKARRHRTLCGPELASRVGRRVARPGRSTAALWEPRNSTPRLGKLSLPATLTVLQLAKRVAAGPGQGGGEQQRARPPSPAAQLSSWTAMVRVRTQPPPEEGAAPLVLNVSASCALARNDERPRTWQSRQRRTPGKLTPDGPACRQDTGGRTRTPHPESRRSRGAYATSRNPFAA